MGKNYLDIALYEQTLTTFFQILGRSIVIHAGEDDLGASGDPSGNSGTRIGCCLIVPDEK
jgi:Cu/Zn superoxide dismutase